MIWEIRHRSQVQKVHYYLKTQSKCLKPLGKKQVSGNKLKSKPIVTLKTLYMTPSHRWIAQCRGLIASYPQESVLTHQSSCSHYLYSLLSQNPTEDGDLVGFSLILQGKHNRTSKHVGIYGKVLHHSEHIVAVSH